MYKVAYGLAAGNTVVLKPASETPVIGLKIGALFEEAGLQPGALTW
jgi:aldehyde dehydrogenase (NAD+)